MSSSDHNTPGDSNPDANPAGDGVDIDARDVAQGGMGRHAFLILIVSTVLVVLVLFAAFGFSALTRGATGPNGGGQEGAAKGTPQSVPFHATDTPSPKQNPAGAPGGS